jgi:hypothetical protein
MNSDPHNQETSVSGRHSPSGTGEETLRLIASLPAPAGLEDRVHSVLRSAPHQARVLSWPEHLSPRRGWMRTAAAAAIVFVVVGGGWGVYSRVERSQPVKVIVMPSRMPAAGGFSSAGAIRTPETLPGPVVIHPIKAHSAQLAKNKKPAASIGPARVASGKAAAGVKPATQNGASK